MGQVSTIGLDIAKRVFQVHGADSAGNEVFRKKLARGKVLTFLASQPSCIVALIASDPIKSLLNVLARRRPST